MAAATSQPDSLLFRVVVAAENSPDSCVVSGTAAEVEAVLLRARQRGASTTMLPVDYALHSPQMEPFCAELESALAGLRHLVATAPDLPFSVDLSDLRGYHYHNGVVFAAYCPDYPVAIALGGRYDGAGKAFGRARPATGFSMDLREVARLAPAGKPLTTATGTASA